MGVVRLDSSEPAPPPLKEVAPLHERGVVGLPRWLRAVLNLQLKEYLPNSDYLMLFRSKRANEFQISAMCLLPPVQDKHSRHGLHVMIEKRKELIKYLRKETD
ncbi:30S ribosomal protein S15 [Striga asiatica]|uniref:30S ribosomal protein S15 n=1 Tax=Striga asiatica TaxID=4170 RepID=A0A5A7QFM4_STRAF|nr:30S ribosomal protein S15 [Striga asiatica]